MSKYDDIINLPHHVSSKHPQMSLHDRAAQFSPFAALTGHSDAVEETARLTESEAMLDDSVVEALNEKLAYLKEHLTEEPVVSITYFEPDKMKDGGKYLTLTGKIKKIDDFAQAVTLEGGSVIGMRFVKDISIGE